MFGVIIIASYNAIGDAGRTIVEILRNGMTPNPIPKKELIELVSPENMGDFKLIVHLYSIKENHEVKNLINPSDLSLNLFYLLTACLSTTDNKSRAYDEYCLLGKAMRIMSENSIISGSNLYGSLAQNNEKLKIIFNDISSDELSKIWIYPNISYKVSVSYIAGPVYINSNESNNVNRVGM